MAARDYNSLTPKVIPNQFHTNESCQVVAIYDEDLTDSPRDPVTLIFPGEQAGSLPKRVVPERVGTRTLLFKTPAYRATFTNRSRVEVLPILHHPDGDIELKPFALTIRNPIRGIIELCVNLATSEAVLPAIITLMLHCKGESCAFQDPQFDRILSVLIGSRSQGSSVSLKDIILPKKQWRRMDVVDLCHKHGLTSSEDQATQLKHGRKLKRNQYRATIAPQHYMNLEILKDNMSTSEPSLSRNTTATRDDLLQNIEGLKAEAEEVYRSTKNVKPSGPNFLKLMVGEDIYVTDKSDTVWYGVCGNSYGCFDPKYVRFERNIETSDGLYSDTEVGERNRNVVHFERTLEAGHEIHSDTEVKGRKVYKISKNTSTDSLQPESQPILDSVHLRRPLVRDPNYENTFIYSSSEESEAFDGHCRTFQRKEEQKASPLINNHRNLKATPSAPSPGSSIGHVPPLLQKKVPPAPPPKPIKEHRISNGSSSDPEEIRGWRDSDIQIPPRNIHRSEGKQSQLTAVAGPGPVPVKPLPKQSQLTAVAGPGPVPVKPHPKQSQHTTVAGPGPVPVKPHPKQSQLTAVAGPGPVPVKPHPKQSQLTAVAGPRPVPVKPLPSPRMKKSAAPMQSVPLPDYMSTTEHEYEEIVNACPPKGHHTSHSNHQIADLSAYPLNILKDELKRRLHKGYQDSGIHYL